MKGIFCVIIPIYCFTKVNLLMFFVVCFDMNCHWRSSYQEGGWYPMNWFIPAILLCLSQAMTWISKGICLGVFCVQWVQLRWDVIIRFVDIDGIVNHYCLYFLFIEHVWKYESLLINSMILFSIQPKLSLQYKIINLANIKKN